MTRNPLMKALWVLFIALFLSVQGLSQAHAVANGGADHTHDGVACEVTLIAAEQVQVAPAPHVPALVILPTRGTDYIAPTAPIRHNFDSRAPPPRGPPLA